MLYLILVIDQIVNEPILAVHGVYALMVVRGAGLFMAILLLKKSFTKFRLAKTFSLRKLYAGKTLVSLGYIFYYGVQILIHSFYVVRHDIFPGLIFINTLNVALIFVLVISQRR